MEGEEKRGVRSAYISERLSRVPKRGSWTPPGSPMPNNWLIPRISVTLTVDNFLMSFSE